jgi:hypothetical protein
MGQYRLWLHLRKVVHDLHLQQTTLEQQLALIDEQIAQIQRSTLHTNNALFTSLLQHTTTQPSINTSLYAQLPTPNNAPSNQTIPHPLPPEESESPHNWMPFAWNHIPEALADYNTDTLEHNSTTEIRPLSTNGSSIIPTTSKHHTFDRASSHINHRLSLEDEVTATLPWWLRNTMLVPSDDQQTQSTTPIDRQSVQTNQRVERWFSRRSFIQQEGEPK